MKQRTLAMMTGFERYTKKTWRALFLEEMEQVVDPLYALVLRPCPHPLDYSVWHGSPSSTGPSAL